MSDALPSALTSTLSVTVPRILTVLKHRYLLSSSPYASSITRFSSTFLRGWASLGFRYFSRSLALFHCVSLSGDRTGAAQTPHGRAAPRFSVLCSRPRSPNNCAAIAASLSFRPLSFATRNGTPWDQNLLLKTKVPTFRFGPSVSRVPRGNGFHALPETRLLAAAICVTILLAYELFWGKLAGLNWVTRKDRPAGYSSLVVVKATFVIIVAWAFLLVS
jgi:hypothetical protein